MPQRNPNAKWREEEQTSRSSHEEKKEASLNENVKIDRKDEDELIDILFDTEQIGDWDMDMTSFETLLADLEIPQAVQCSINRRIDVLKDACLNKKPETSIFWNQMKSVITEISDGIPGLVDQKRKELDLPEICSKDQETKREEEDNGNKVYNF